MSNFNGRLKIVGLFQLWVYDASGNLIDYAHENNLVVNGGMDAIVKLIGSYTLDKNVTKIGFGENGADPIATDTALINGFVQALDNTTYPAANKVSFYFSLALEDNNGAEISEFGLLCEDNTLFARKNRATIEKTDEIRLEGIWTLTLTAS